MKKYVSLLLSVMLMFVASACTSDDGLKTRKTEMNEGQWHHTTMSLGISKESFDAKGSASTRTISDEWQDGDKLYLRFVTFDGVVMGTARYSATKGLWDVSYNGTLNENIKSKLFVVFLDNVEAEGSESEEIPLDCFHGVYADEDGTYILNSQNELKVKASLKSLTSRVRIKSDVANVNFKLIGLTYYKGYNPNTHEFTLSSDTTVVRTSTNKDKESRYIYVKSLIESNRQIMLGRSYEEGSYIFKAICSNDMFVVGKSGVIKMPTKTNYNGWNMKQVSGMDEKGHVWVDLELPSGILWAKYNFGANITKWQETGDSKYILGNMCKWGSIDYTNWSQTTTDIGGTNEDIVTMAWGDKWRIPNCGQVEELEDNIFKSTIFYNSVQCRVCKGKNDEKIVLPMVDYWTSNPDDTSFEWAYTWNPGLSSFAGGFIKHKNDNWPIRPIYIKD